MALSSVEDAGRKRAKRDTSRSAAGTQTDRLTFFIPHAVDAEARRRRYCVHWAVAVPGGVACGLVPFVSAGGFGFAPF